MITNEMSDAELDVYYDNLAERVGVSPNATAEELVARSAAHKYDLIAKYRHLFDPDLPSTNTSKKEKTNG